MIGIAIAFTLGCLLFLQLPTMPNITWLWALLPTCILLLFNTSRLLAIAILGALWTLLHANYILSHQLPSHLVGQDLVVVGTISNIPQYQQNRVSFEFKPDQSTHALPNKIRLSWYQHFPRNLHAGEKWQLTMRLKQPRGLVNPGTFDYEGWLFQQNTGATGYVRGLIDNKRISPPAFYDVNALRQKLIARIDSHLKPSAYLALIQGLTTGVRHNITPEQWQVLRLSGTSHLLAISGLHIGLAATVGFFLTRWLWSRRANHLLRLPANEAGAVGGFIFALFYAALSGFSIPSQRAMIMVSVFMGSLLVRRPIPTSTILATSLLLVVMVNPLSVLSAGFWLSFTAVAIILFVSQHRFPAPRWQWVKIHILIALGLTPLLLIFFLQTSIIAPIANFIAIPLVSLLVVPILLAASVLIWLADPVGAFLLHTVKHILHFLWITLDYLASLPYSHWNSAPLPILYWPPIILGTIILLAPKKLPAKWLGLIGFSPLFLNTIEKPQYGEFWFTLLDVGQGLSAIIQTQNHTLVFDTGAKFNDNFNMGTAIIQPFLQHQGIKKIDTLIVSHSDNDHIGGAIPLINNVPVDTILTSATDKLLKSIPCYAGEEWQWDGIYFSILHPADDYPKKTSNKNNQSCVLKVGNKQNSLLLTADIEYNVEQKLIANYGDQLKSTILVVPHHGSHTSSSEVFIRAVKPEFALFPTGYRNRYRLPAKAVIERYQKEDITMLNSAHHGAIQFKINAHDYSLTSTWRQASAKIWRSNTTD